MGGLGQHRDFCGYTGNRSIVDSGLYRFKISYLCNDFEVRPIFLDVFCTGLDSDLHQGILVDGTAFNDNIPFLIKHIGNATGRTEIAAGFAEYVADIGHSSVLVIGQRFYENSRTPRPIAFIDNLFIVDALQFTGALLYASFNVVLRHVFSLCRLYRGSQPWVGTWVSAAQACGNSDFLDETGKCLTPLRISGAFLVLYRRPFAMP